MHVMVNEYAKGGRVGFEVSNDGREYLGEWDGQRQVGERICAFLEAACDDNEQGYDRLLDAVALLTKEIEKRKAAAANAAKAAG
jgi:hypothetical protein